MISIVIIERLSWLLNRFFVKELLHDQDPSTEYICKLNKTDKA